MMNAQMNHGSSSRLDRFHLNLVEITEFSKQIEKKKIFIENLPVCRLASSQTVSKHGMALSWQK